MSRSINRMVTQTFFVALCSLLPLTVAKAPTHTSRDKAVLGAPDFPLMSVESGVMDAGGIVEPIAGTTNDDPGFDAVVLVIAP